MLFKNRHHQDRGKPGSRWTKAKSLVLSITLSTENASNKVFLLAFGAQSRYNAKM
jgi:hypothetical protein